MRSPPLFVLRSFVAVATSPAMQDWQAYREKVERERGLGAEPAPPKAADLLRVIGERPLIPPSTTPLVGSLVSFLDDYSAPFPGECFPAAEAAALFHELGVARGHSMTPSALLAASLEVTDDALQALLACHLATRQLARGRDARAFGGSGMSLDKRCEIGRAVAPFPDQLAQGGDPLGDTYHYFANVIAGIAAALDPVAGPLIAGLFYAGPDLMQKVRERTFRRPLFFGNHARVDRCGLAHGLAIGRGGGSGAREARGVRGQARR